MFLTEKQTLEPRARRIPNKDEGTFDQGSEATAVVKIAAMINSKLMLKLNLTNQHWI